jgi:hypothetical protein
MVQEQAGASAVAQEVSRAEKPPGLGAFAAEAERIAQDLLLGQRFGYPLADKPN